MRHKRVAIIGGGITGLTAAYDLARNKDNIGAAKEAAAAITIYESNSFLGGLAAGFKGRPEWDWPLEHFYHHLFTNDDAILGLTEELGLNESLEIHRPTTAIHHQGKNYPLDSVTRVLTFPLIPLIDRIRMGMVIAYLRFHPRPPWRQFDRMLAHEWARRWMGSKAYEAAWEFQLQGKFGQHYRSVNMAWLWARVYKRTPKLGYYRGGFQAFIDRLAQSVQQQGVTIHLNTPVNAIMPQNEGVFTITTSDHPPINYDAVLSTVSPGLMQQMAPTLPTQYLEQLKSLKSMGAVVVTVALDRRLTKDMYWISLPKNEGVPLLALVEHTNMIDPAHYGGDHLIYLGDYLEPDHYFFEMSVDELLDELLPHLSRFNPDFERSWVTGAWVHKVKYAQPVPPVGYAEMIPDIRTPLPGLYFASMSQVYPWDRGTNYAVEMGRKVAKMIESDG
ncbi:NAD(P)/FAD-dependent oxidoreductase [Chloroflexi bacterium TSY]|nr:NAD(P)/FAD-dependent oxidoreductase [Chloroflexi bacterium TSY]